MVRAPSFGGVILAAGESSRMGTEKALLPWPPLASGQSLAIDTFLSAAIRSLALADFVLIVAGKNEGQLAPIVYANGASLIVNPDPERGQFSSLQVGLREVLNRGRDAAIVALIDRPPVSALTVQALRNAFEVADDDIWAIIPEFSEKRGHPIVVGREMIEAFLRAGPDSSAREVLAQHRDRLRYIAVNDPFVALNINTPEEYKQLEAQGEIL